MQAYYISLVCQVKHGLLGAAGLSHQPRSSFPLIFTPSTLPLSLSFLLLLFTSLIPVCLFLSSLVKTFIWIHIQATRRSSHMYTARHSTELRFHRVHSYCAEMQIKWRSRKHQAIRRWAIITQTTPDHGERIWGAADMHKLKKKGRGRVTGCVKLLKERTRRRQKLLLSYQMQATCCAAIGQQFWGSLGSKSLTSSHRSMISSYDTLQAQREDR